MGVLPSKGELAASDINIAMGITGTTLFYMGQRNQEWYNMAQLPGGVFYGTEATPHSFDDFHGGEWALCFIAGTKIAMGDGTLKDIEDVAVGDEVIAYNPNKVLFAPKAVLAAKITENDGSPLQETIIIDFEDGTQLHCTDSNPFWVPGKYWCSYNTPKCQYDHSIASNPLDIGDTCVVYRDGVSGLTAITNITVVKEPVTTYSLTIAMWATFIANGIVTHNKCIDGSALATMADGTTKPLRDLQIGDVILSYNGESFVEDRVRWVRMIPHTGIYEYTFHKDKIKATAGHPFLLSSGEYGAYDPETALVDYEIECAPLDPMVDAMTYFDGDTLPIVCSGIKLVDEEVEHETYIIKLDKNNCYIADSMLVYTGIAANTT